MHDDEITLEHAVREKAQLLFEADDCQVDQDAEILFTDEGAWVQAWIWVPEENEE